MIKKTIFVFLVAVCVTNITIAPCYAKDKIKIYVDAGHGCEYTSSSNSNPYGFASTGANGEALYVGGFSNHLINSFNHTKRYEALGISALSLPDGTVGDRAAFGNSGRRELYINSDCDVMLQIHYDYSEDPADTGAHVIYSANSKNSAILARCIARKMEENGLRMLDRIDGHTSERHELSIYQEPTDKPIVLIEVGFGTENQLDHEYIRDKSIKRLFYKSIIEGTDDFCILEGSE